MFKHYRVYVKERDFQVILHNRVTDQKVVLYSYENNLGQVHAFAEGYRQALKDLTLKPRGEDDGELE